MGQRTRTFRHWLPALAWAALIFVLSAQSGSRVPGRWSSELHVAVYAVLGVLVWYGLGGRAAGLRGALLAVAIASVYGVTDEFHQSFVPLRTPDPLDWAADTLGAALGVAAACWVAGRRAAKRDPATAEGTRSG